MMLSTPCPMVLTLRVKQAIITFYGKEDEGKTPKLMENVDWSMTPSGKETRWTQTLSEECFLLITLSNK